MAVRSVSVSSSRRSLEMICSVPSTGTLVKRLTTSKLAMRFTKSVEFFTCESVDPSNARYMSSCISLYCMYLIGKTCIDLFAYCHDI